MSKKYSDNHYVPVWYQKRFLPEGQLDRELYYLNLRPKVFFDAKQQRHAENAVQKKGPKAYFHQEDLYTTYFGKERCTDIEQGFFGHLDQIGPSAASYFETFKHPSVDGNAFQNLMIYMSTQKLRTPKGLEWLAEATRNLSHESVLREMLRLRHLHCAIWSESVWQIANASESETKFIISDHPITIYNRECGPRSHWCGGCRDPDIWMVGSHTLFPLSLEKILILTNLAWVRNPYQSAKKLRPNPNPLRDAIFDFTGIQTMRNLCEKEVREINFIIKSRAYRYIAAANQEWLFPESHVSKSEWNTFGKGYLLMPDPRAVTLGGNVIIGYESGAAEAFDAYGRRPWQQGYGNEFEHGGEHISLYRFQGEFARLFGPNRRGRAHNFCHLDNERDDPEFHQCNLDLENIGRRKKK